MEHEQKGHGKGQRLHYGLQKIFDRVVKPVVDAYVRGSPQGSLPPEGDHQALPYRVEAVPDIAAFVYLLVKLFGVGEHEEQVQDIRQGGHEKDDVIAAAHKDDGCRDQGRYRRAALGPGTGMPVVVHLLVLPAVHLEVFKNHSLVRASPEGLAEGEACHADHQGPVGRGKVENQKGHDVGKKRLNHGSPASDSISDDSSGHFQEARHDLPVGVEHADQGEA